jgi:hypothetical protein
MPRLVSLIRPRWVEAQGSKSNNRSFGFAALLINKVDVVRRLTNRGSKLAPCSQVRRFRKLADSSGNHGSSLRFIPGVTRGGLPDGSGGQLSSDAIVQCHTTNEVNQSAGEIRLPRSSKPLQLHRSTHWSLVKKWWLLFPVFLFAVLSPRATTPRYAFEVQNGKFQMDRHSFRVLFGEMHFARISCARWRYPRAQGRCSPAQVHDGLGRGSHPGPSQGCRLSHVWPGVPSSPPDHGSLENKASLWFE